MLGGGFGILADMNKTLKLNRDNLKRSLPKPFDKDRLTDRSVPAGEPLKDAPPMSAAERDRLILRLKEENRRRTYITIAMILGLTFIGFSVLAIVFA